VIYGALTGNLADVTEAALSSAKEAVTLCITMTGVMAFWVGMMQIAEQADILERAASALRPILRFLFPRIPNGHPAYKYIAVNMVANIFGLGWAATPAGLSAMKELDELAIENKNQPAKRASREMCTFLIINISSLQLIPVNIIAYRSQYGSVHAAYIVGPAIAATAISTLAGVVFCKTAEKIDILKERKTSA
jgi:spore maturation protein A